MTITINGESYNPTKTHALFKQGRDAIKAQGVTGDHKCINQVLTCTEIFVHLLGNLPAISDYVKDQ